MHCLEAIASNENADSFSSSFDRCNTGSLLMSFHSHAEKKISRGGILEKCTEMHESRQFQRIEAKLTPLGKVKVLYGS